MPDIKISELTEANLPLDGTEDLVIVQSAVSRRCSAQDIADLAGGGAITVKVSLSSAEILALNTTPKVIVLALGDGKIIQPISFVARYIFGTTSYTTNVSLQLRYSGVTGNLTSSSFIALPNSAILRQIPTANLTFTPSTGLPDNKSLIVDISGGNPVAGDGTLDIYVTYAIITL